MRRALQHAAVRSLMAASLALVGAAVHAVSPGEPAPDLQLTGPQGPVHLASLRGQWVYLDFWASWCGPCRQSFPWMNQLQSRHGPNGLQVVAVNVDTRPEDAQRFLAEVPARFTVAFDPKGDSPRRYAIPGMPTSVLIGPDGKVRWVHSGFRAEDRAELDQRIAQSLGQP